MAQARGGGGSHRDATSGANNIPGEISPRPPSNEKLLCTAFVSFQCFAIVQVIAAFLAGSEAMMADAAAMMVDAFSYLFNWYAERQKDVNASKLSQRGHSTLYILEYRRSTYQLELVTPLVSISSLLILTGFMLNKSIRTLVLDSKRDVSDQADPNVQLMFIMSVLNLLLDVVNVWCFASSKLAAGYTNTTTDRAVSSSQDDDTMDCLPTSVRDKSDFLFDDEEEMISLSHNNSVVAGRINPEQNEDDDRHIDVEPVASLMKPFEMEGSAEDGGTTHFHRSAEDYKSNLNMCSAFTHVFADTLRSLAVIVASFLAEFVPFITSEEADAAAAVVVSILIVLSLVPLVGGMVQTFKAVQDVNQQLRKERNQRTEVGGEIQFQDDDFDDDVDDDDDAPSDNEIDMIAIAKSVK